MDDWKKAFKVIHGKAPKKTNGIYAPDLKFKNDCEAGTSTSNTLFNTNSHSTVRLKRACIKDSHLFQVNQPKRFKPSTNRTTTSPLKKLNGHETSPLKKLNGHEMMLLSPTKVAADFTPNELTNSTPNFKEHPQRAIVPATPSPRKSMRKNVVSRNIHLLMFSPEKSTIKNPESVDENSENLPPDGNKKMEMFESVPIEKIDKPRPKRRTKDKGNFVRLNMRKKSFVKKKNDPKKKKWYKRFKSRRFN
uniref:Uncharacterized protein n=1 Tax=Acrobeloides nanus TaxID=290746 RepID=A0A914ELS3_9BILA